MKPAIFRKDFWKFFGSTLWTSKYMLIKSLVVAVMWLVISIFTNRMDLSNLTIYNGVLTLAFFLEWTSFGFGNAIVVLMGKHSNNKEKIKKTVSNIISFAFLILLIFAVLFVVFKKFMLKNIVSISLDVPNVFYCCMIAYGVMSALCSILTHIFQAFEQFKVQLIVSIVQSVIFVVAFIIIFFSKNLNLDIIGIIFIAIISLIFILISVLLIKNKKQSINIFKIEKPSLSKSEMLSVLNISGMQVVYIIGYTCISLFLLKRNEIVFNSYQYLENVLDLFNGIFYAFGAVVLIKISQCVNDKNNQEAYKIGKYSNYSMIIIWLIYIALSAIAFIPYQKGANIDIQEMVKRVYFVYAGLFLFRFLTWNLGSYVLSAAGKANLQMISEIVGAVYFVLLFVFAKKIIDNEFLLLVLVFADVIIKLPIFLAYFKSKRWLKDQE